MSIEDLQGATAEHAIEIDSVVVEGNHVAVVHKNTLHLDGVHHATFETVERYNLTPPTFHSDDGFTLVMAGGFPAGATLHYRVGTHEADISVGEDRLHYELVDLISDGLPDPLVTVVTSENTPQGDDFYTAIKFVTEDDPDTELSVFDVSATGMGTDELPQSVIDYLQAVLS